MKLPSTLNALLLSFLTAIYAVAAEPAKAPDKEQAELPQPSSRTDRDVEGWKVRVDDRLLKAPEIAIGTDRKSVV